jgi:hypothetical protein
MENPKESRYIKRTQKNNRCILYRILPEKELGRISNRNTKKNSTSENQFFKKKLKMKTIKIKTTQKIFFSTVLIIYFLENLRYYLLLFLNVINYEAEYLY